jgi:hypothetical protein
MTTKLSVKIFLALFFSFVSTFIFGQNIPPAPANLHVTASVCGQVSLAWDDYPVQIVENNYELFMSSDGENGNYFHLETVYNQFSVNINFNYRSPGTYYFKIRAYVNGINSYYSSPLQFLYSCAGPTNLIGTNVSCTNVSMQWSAPTDAVVSRYDIFRSESETGQYTNIGNVAANVLNFTDNFSNSYPEIKTGKNYYYKVRATKNGSYTD